MGLPPILFHRMHLPPHAMQGCTLAPGEALATSAPAGDEQPRIVVPLPDGMYLGVPRWLQRPGTQGTPYGVLRCA